MFIRIVFPKKVKGYKSSYDKDGTEDVFLEGEQSQAHVREDEILSQEVKNFKELWMKNYFSVLTQK